MITSHLMGGLGNMLFQIAAAASLATNNKDYFVFSEENTSDLKHGKIKDYKSNIFRNIQFLNKLNISHVYREPFFAFKNIEYSSNLCLFGYFQSEKYFKQNEVLIRNLFEIDDNTKEYLLNKYGKYFNNNIITSIHIRRGDSFENLDCHPICKIKYYDEAIKFIDHSDLFFVFSDDIEWCKKKFIGEKFVFIEGNKDYQDLYLMSMCNNNITANSTFSWWAAWLNKNKDKKIVSPKLWFGPRLSMHDTKDLIPDDWKIL